MTAFADFFDLPRNVASLLIHHYCTKETCCEWREATLLIIYQNSSYFNTLTRVVTGKVTGFVKAVQNTVGVLGVFRISTKGIDKIRELM